MSNYEYMFCEFKVLNVPSVGWLYSRCPSEHPALCCASTLKSFKDIPLHLQRHPPRRFIRGVQLSELTHTLVCYSIIQCIIEPHTTLLNPLHYRTIKPTACTNANGGNYLNADKTNDTKQQVHLQILILNPITFY